MENWNPFPITTFRNKFSFSPSGIWRAHVAMDSAKLRWCRSSSTKWAAGRGAARPTSGVNGRRAGSGGNGGGISRGRGGVAARGKGRMGRGLNEAAEALLGMGGEGDEEPAAAVSSITAPASQYSHSHWWCSTPTLIHSLGVLS